MKRILEQAPQSLVFTVKAHRHLTHQRGAELDSARHFRRALAPLHETGRLGAVIAQFPFSFVHNPHNRAYVYRLKAALELPLVVEFRNESWMSSHALDFLRGWGVGIVCVDAPPVGGLPSPMAVATSDVAYVRFHGRNAEAWWRKDSDVRATSTTVGGTSFSAGCRVSGSWAGRRRTFSPSSTIGAAGEQWTMRSHCPGC